MILQPILNFAGAFLQRQFLDNKGKAEETESSSPGVDPDILQALVLSPAIMKRMDQRLAELHDWHDKEDEDGVKVWYVRASLIKAIDSLAKSQEAIAQMLPQICSDVRETRRVVDRIDARNHQD